MSSSPEIPAGWLVERLFASQSDGTLWQSEDGHDLFPIALELGEPVFLRVSVSDPVPIFPPSYWA